MNDLLIILFLSITFLLCNSCLKEGYISNQPPPNKPDDLQFYACHDYSSTNNLGNTNYKLKKHDIGEPLQGPYTYFLDEYGIRNYDEIFHSPICERHYNFNDVSSVNVPSEILDHEDLLRQDEILSLEEEYDKNSVKDPYYLYGNPEYIANKLIYSDEINELFLKNHTSHDEENLLHRLDQRIDQK